MTSASMYWLFGVVKIILRNSVLNEISKCNYGSKFSTRNLQCSLKLSKLGAFFFFFLFLAKNLKIIINDYCTCTFATNPSISIIY